MFQILSSLQQPRGTGCKKSSAMTQFTPLETWKRSDIPLGIHSKALIWRFQGVWVSIWGQCREFEKSYMAARKPHSNRSDKNSTPEFVREILATIDNDPCKSIKCIASDMGVSEFLIKQVVHEDIQYFPWARTNFYFRSWGTREKISLRSLSPNSNILSYRMSFVFSNEKN